jgi:hypothetical protein
MSSTPQLPLATPEAEPEKDYPERKAFSRRILAVVPD